MSNTNDNKHLISGIIASCVLVAFFCAGAFTGQYCQKDKQEKVVEEKIKEVYVEGEELDEWTILTMAIMKNRIWIFRKNMTVNPGSDVYRIIK